VLVPRNINISSTNGRIVNSLPMGEAGVTHGALRSLLDLAASHAAVAAGEIAALPSLLLSNTHAITS
jgi:hypothetical protein